MQTRIAALLGALDWLQKDLAAYLGVDRTVVSRLANGQSEPGPVSRLLDLLAQERGWPHLTAASWAPPAPPVDPAPALPPEALP